MVEMTDRERVVGTLTKLHGKLMEGDNFVVIMSEDYKEAIRDAIDMLRDGIWLLSLDEALQKTNLYVELRGDLVVRRAYLQRRSDGSIRATAPPTATCECPPDAYMKSWRCWNSAPTQKMMEATPWMD